MWKKNRGKIMLIKIGEIFTSLRLLIKSTSPQTQSYTHYFSYNPPVQLTVATSFLLLSLKWAVPTRYKMLPSGAVRRVTVSGSSGDDCRRWARNCQSSSIASLSATREWEKSLLNWQKNTSRECRGSYVSLWKCTSEEYINKILSTYI